MVTLSLDDVLGLHKNPEKCVGKGRALPDELRVKAFENVETVAGLVVAFLPGVLGGSREGVEQILLGYLLNPPVCR